MQARALRPWLGGWLLVGVLPLWACGGGGDNAPPAPGAPTPDQRSAAATSAAQSNAACTAVQPFSWEIGDRGARLASGSANAAGNATVSTSSSSMSVAAASKWLYGAYVYPWVDASKRWYGVLARREGTGEGIDSAFCGRLIRKAWITAIAQ